MLDKWNMADTSCISWRYEWESVLTTSYSGLNFTALTQHIAQRGSSPRHLLDLLTPLMNFSLEVIICVCRRLFLVSMTPSRLIIINLWSVFSLYIYMSTSLVSKLLLNPYFLSVKLDMPWLLSIIWQFSEAGIKLCYKKLFTVVCTHRQIYSASISFRSASCSLNGTIPCRSSESCTLIQACSQ